MSSMLEQAIIDANTLKEVAMKTAEESIIEKYSDEIKGAVESLLEQDGDDFDLEREVDIDIPLAATDGEDFCPCPEDEEEVELDLSDIKKELERIESGESGEELGSPEPHEMAAAEMPALEEGKEAEELEEISSMAAGSVTGFRGKRDDDDEEEEIDIDEEQLEEIIEKLVVDMKPTMNGWAGRPEAELEHEVEVGLAALEGDELEGDDEDEEGEELKEENDKLKKEIEKLKERNNKLTNKQKDYKKAVSMLKEKLEEMSVSNAKLIYTNRIFNSDSLNERQKNKVAEAILNVGSAEEAKVVFETLQRAVGSSSKARGPKSLSEAIEKRSSVLMVNRKGQETKASNPIKNRMQKLAGIN